MDQTAAIDQVLLQLRVQAHLFRELAVGSRKDSRSPTGFFPHAAQLRVHVLQLRRGQSESITLCIGSCFHLPQMLAWHEHQRF